MILHRNQEKRTLEISATLTDLELGYYIDRNVKHLVIERLANDLYEKYKEEFLNKIDARTITKMFYKKLENRMVNHLNSLFRR